LDLLLYPAKKILFTTEALRHRDKNHDTGASVKLFRSTLDDVRDQQR